MPQQKKSAYTANMNRNKRSGRVRRTQGESCRRWQRIFFISIAAILILSWILTLVVK